jgi:hypothetical protein
MRFNERRRRSLSITARTPIGLSDDQLRLVMLAAHGLPIERRSEFLECVAEQLHVRDNVALTQRQ